jgi:iron complex transport system substrate-binding protein
MRRFWPLLPLMLLFIASYLLMPSSAEQTTSKPKDYQRIVSLAPNITETLYAIGAGDRLVAVTDYCEYPPAALALPKVGGYLNTSVESIVRYQPDLVVLLTEQADLASTLNRLGIETHIVDNHSLAAIQDAIISLGKLTDQMQTAQQVIEQIAQKINTTAQDISTFPPTQHDIYNELLTMAGGTNVYTDKLIRVPVVSAEGILQMNPDVIIDIFPEADDHHTDMTQLKQQWQQLEHVSAIKNDQLYFIEKDYATVPGPRIFDLLPDFTKALHPELVDD